MERNLPPPYRLKAFTLSEVLITLVIIGVVAAITVPVLNTQIRKEQYRSSLFKAISTLNQAALKYYNIYGENAKCGYWKKNPYGSDYCVGYDDKGNCKGWKLKDGSNLPSDYNGVFDDCGTLWKSFYETLLTSKICKSNAYANGCIPKYKGAVEIYSSKNTEATDYDSLSNTAGAPFRTQNSILKGSAIVLNDGMIIFSANTESARYLGIDVNGQKGPNKWGTDVYCVYPWIIDRFSPVEFYSQSYAKLNDKGGMYSKDLLYK